MATLLEAYKARLRVSESVYARQHNGEKMDNNRKLMVARILANTNNFLNEAFDSASGATQRSDMGLYKKFCLNLTTVALPNLIANDLVIVHPMSSMSGYVTYLQYTAGKTKGETTNGDLFANPWQLGNVDSRYTSQAVVEAAEAGTGAQSLAWLQDGDIVHGAFPVESGGTTTYYDIKLVKSGADDIYGFYKAEDKKFYSAFDGTTYSTQITVAADTKVAYMYDNIVVPQNDLPTLKAEMKSIPLIAKARRIAVFYSQLAAFQAKTDYGFDLGDQLAEQAVGRLSYEIDTEVTQLLYDNAVDGTGSGLTWSRTLPVGVSKTEHYSGFAEILEIGRQKIYDATKRFMPNYMLIASNILPIITFIPNFQPAPTGQVNGPYLAGTLNGMKIFVTPNIDAGKFVIGCNGSDMMSSAAVYAPYMAIVPTQLLQYADGGTSQGFSTLYDLKLLNTSLIVKGQVTA